jgi:hypothetical protein
MDNIQITELIALLRAGRKHTLTIVDSVPETHYFKQLAPGKATPLWLLGHLARTVDRILLVWTLEQAPLMDDELGTQFAPEHVGGTPPTSNPADYPSWDAVKDFYVRAMHNAIEGLSALTDADLEKPLPGDLPPAYRDRFPSIGAALRLVINHDAYHRGQMGLLAKLDA